MKADPRKDFAKFIEETVRLLDYMGNAIVSDTKTVALFARGYSQKVAEYIEHVATHPKEFSARFVEGNVDLMKRFGLLMLDAYSQPELGASAEEFALYEGNIQARTKEVADLYKHLAKTVPQMTRDDWERVCRI